MKLQITQSSHDKLIPKGTKVALFHNEGNTILMNAKTRSMILSLEFSTMTPEMDDEETTFILDAVLAG